MNHYKNGKKTIEHIKKYYKKLSTVTKNPPKNNSKKGKQLFHPDYVILGGFWSIALFLCFFCQSGVIDIKQDILMTLFLDLLCESCPKAFERED